MSKSPATPSTPLDPARLMHRAARIEDWLHDKREKFARRRGHLPIVIPYTGYGTTERVRILCRVLLSKPVKSTGTTRKRRRNDKRDASIRGWRSFTSVPVNDVTVTIDIGGKAHRVQADRGGVVDTVMQVSLEPGWHTAQLHTHASGSVDAPVFVVAPDVRTGVISDVDDTVMVTTLPRPLLAAWNTFVLDEHARVPTPGMAVLLDRLADATPGAPVIYLSTGAWNVAPTLSRFLSRNLYPSGPLLLTDWGPTHDRWFRSGRLHKQTSLDRLAEEFPQMRWLLVGDDGQHDEELYGRFLRDHRENVAAVAIRQLSPSEAVLAGGRSRAEHAEGSDVAWVSAPDGAGLWDQLRWSGAVPVDAERDL